MANEEQVAILRQGVAAWNIWREENPDAKIDLSNKTLHRLPNLIGIDFCDADLSGSFFYGTDFTNAIFERAFVTHATFHDTILTNTYWGDAQGLDSAYWENTLFDDEDVRHLLVRYSGQGLSLQDKNLKGVYLVEFDLRGVDLRGTDFRQADLSGADITGAKLYNTARENWTIDGIRCDYVYWDEAGEQRTPPDRDFRPGEFEELYKQLPTFEYIFEQGFTPLDPLIMQRVVQAVNERHKEFSLDLVNFDKRGQPHATFTVCHLEHVEKAKQQIAAGYEENRIAPERQEPYMQIISRLLDQNDKSLDIIKQFGGAAMRDKYSITVSNGGQVGGIGDHATVSGNTFQQITADLSRLHEEMQRSAKTPEQRAAAEDVAKAAQAAREQNEPAVRQHLKNAGIFALDFAKTVGTDVAAEYLKKVTLGI
ncbi:MAG: pentapeptide repeat-containing protein [Candidatus Electronema sp. VV]